MLGTFVNVVCILIGSAFGGVIRKFLPPTLQNRLFDAMGLAALALGIHAISTHMPNSSAPVLFIVSLALGSIIGYAIDIDAKVNKRIHTKGKNQLSEGLTTAFLLFCIGSLSILGPIQSALYQDHTYLLTNATLDLVSSSVLASTYGIKIAWVAPILLVWQGSIYMFAIYLQDFMNSAFMSELSIVGGILIMATGLSILKIKEFKTLNLLPALLIPVIYFMFV